MIRRKKLIQRRRKESVSRQYAQLDIEEIEGDRYRIDEYNGNESVVVPNEEEWIVIK